MKIILGFIFFVSQISFLAARHAVFGAKHTLNTVEFCGQTPVGEALSNSKLPSTETRLVQASAEHPRLSTIDYRLRAPLAHDYHISNFEIEYNAETKAIEIIAKIFIDDLEDGIAASGVEEKLYLCTDREIETGDDQIYTYLSNKMNISLDGQSRSFNYIGKEASEDLVAMYCYLEIEDVQSINEITVSNDMLMDLFDDQINIVKLKSKSTGKRGFMMLKKGEHSDTVNLQ